MSTMMHPLAASAEETRRNSMVQMSQLSPPKNLTKTQKTTLMRKETYSHILKKHKIVVEDDNQLLGDFRQTMKTIVKQGDWAKNEAELAGVT